jgi:glycosyltransferase involved in cell wall biosynthesis
VPVEDAEALAAAILELIRSRAKERIGPFAAQYARNGFSWSKQVEGMIALYTQAAEGQG